MPKVIGALKAFQPLLSYRENQNRCSFYVQAWMKGTTKDTNEIVSFS